MAQRTTAQESAANATRALDKARDRAAQVPMPLPVVELSRALTAADKLGDITADIARRTRTLERKAKALNASIASLGLPTDLPAPVPGTSGVQHAESAADRVALLREIAIPPEKTEARYAETLADVDREIREARDTYARLNDELADIHERIVAMKVAGDVATEDDLKAARHARDEGWALVRGFYIDRHAGLEEAARRFAPDGRIAEAYEAHARDADRAVDTLRARVRESTELALLRRRVADLERKRAEVMEATKALGERRDGLLSEWRALWPADLITVQSPGEMGDWLARRRNALATADEVEEEHDAIAGLAGRERVARQGLAAAIAAFSAEADGGGLEALRDQARRIIDDVAQAKSRYDKAEAAVRGMSEQKVQADEYLDKVESRIREWETDWRKALAEASLPSDRTVETVAATLEILNELDGLKSKIDGLSQRIEAMRADREAFSDAVARMAATLPDAPAGTAVEVCRWLEERLRAARRAEMEYRSLAEQLESRTAERDRVGEKLRRSQAVLDALCAQARVADADQLAEIERKSAEKRDALREREKIETRVREDGGGHDFTALFEECADVPGDLIPADLIGLKADRDDVESRVDKLGSERGALQNEFDTLLGQNQAADLAQDAAAVGAEIEDTVDAYVDLTVQETLLRAAIDVYRDRHQGPILTRARNLFVQLTDGAYTGLRADVERGETILIVEDASRGSLELDALSDGTVDAVYLALRLAVVQEHNATHEPLPFIADDLLLNLDNSRSQAALRTLAELATSGQVLLFTHHAHMVSLARSAVPSGILVGHSLSPSISGAERRRAAASR